jgi:hypothetical protein
VGNLVLFLKISLKNKKERKVNDYSTNGFEFIDEERLYTSFFVCFDFMSLCKSKVLLFVMCLFSPLFSLYYSVTGNDPKNN